jgi:hypothetical protein
MSKHGGRRGAQGRVLSSHGPDAGSRQLHGRLLFLHRQVSWRSVGRAMT